MRPVFLLAASFIQLAELILPLRGCPALKEFKTAIDALRTVPLEAGASSSTALDISDEQESLRSAVIVLLSSLRRCVLRMCSAAVPAHSSEMHTV